MKGCGRFSGPLTIKVQIAQLNWQSLLFVFAERLRFYTRTARRSTPVRPSSAGVVVGSGNADFKAPSRSRPTDRPPDRPTSEEGAREGEVIRGRRQFHGNWVLSNCYPRPLPLCPTQMPAPSPGTTTLCHVRAEIKKDSCDGILWTWRVISNISRMLHKEAPPSLTPSPATRERRKIYACYLVRLSPPRAQHAAHVKVPKPTQPWVIITSDFRGRAQPTTHMFTCLSGKARFRLTLNRGKNEETMIANQFVDEVFVAWPRRKGVLVLETICHNQIRTIGKRVEIVRETNHGL